MNHPEAPSALPLEGRHQRPGRAGSAVALVQAMRIHVPRPVKGGLEQLR